MKTVAIVGSHSGTRAEIPWDDASIPVWVFNEAASIGWPERVDGVFQMHAEPVWKNPLNRNDANFPRWLKKRHPFPIWMLEEYYEVPASVKYPLEEICAEFLVGITKGEAQVRYFTSTVAYAIALAIYEGFERIELYGVEMASDTEYRYQRDGVFFWLGIAQGRGIEIHIPEGSSLFTEPLYGYEGGAYLKSEQLIKRKELLESKRPMAEVALEKANLAQMQALDAAMEESGGEAGLANEETTRRYLMSIKAQADAIMRMGTFVGAIAEVNRYLAKCEQMDAESGDHLLARQEFEITAAQADKLMVQRKAKMDAVGMEARNAWTALGEAVKKGAKPRQLNELSSKYHRLHQDYLNEVFEYGKVNGVLQENVTLLGMVDELIKAAGGVKAVDPLLAAVNGKLKGRVLEHA